MAKSYQEILQELNQKSTNLTYTEPQDRLQTQIAKNENRSISLPVAQRNYMNAKNDLKVAKNIMSQKISDQGITTNKFSVDKLPSYNTIQQNSLNNFNLNKDYDSLKYVSPSKETEFENERKYRNYQNTKEFQDEFQKVEKAKDTMGYARYNYDVARVNSENVTLYDKTLGTLFRGLVNFTDVGPKVRDGKDGYIELPSYNDLKQQQVQESYDNDFWGAIGKVANMATFEIGRQGTSILTNMIAPGMGNVSYFGSMLRDQIQEAENQGYSEKNAVIYGTLSTALEIVTGKFLGGVTKQITGGRASELNQAIANGLGRIMNNRGMINVLSHAGSEATEEFIQEFMDRALRNITLGEKNDVLSSETLSDAIYSAAVGGLTGAFGSIGDHSINVQTKKDRMLAALNIDTNTSNSISSVNVDTNSNADISSSNDSSNVVNNSDNIQNIESSIERLTTLRNSTNDIQEKAELSNQIHLLENQLNELKNLQQNQTNSFFPTINNLPMSYSHQDLNNQTLSSNNQATSISGGNNSVTQSNVKKVLATDITDNGTLMPSDVYKYPERYFDMSKPIYQESMKVLTKIHNNPDATVTVYQVTTDDNVNSKNWVTLSETYAKDYNERVLSNQAKISSKKVRATDLQVIGNNINELEYFPSIIAPIGQINGNSSIDQDLLNKYRNVDEIYAKEANNYDGIVNVNNLDIDLSNKNATEIYHIATEIFKKNHNKNVFINNGNQIRVTNQDIKESVNKIFNDRIQNQYLKEHLSIFSDLGDIIEHSRLVNQSFENKGNFKYNTWNYYFNGLKINNELFDLEFDVVSRVDGENHYKLQTLKIANNDGTIVNPNRYQYVKSDNIKIDNLRKSASQYFNNSQETQNFVNTIENIISDTDYNITFDNTLKGKNGNAVNAQIVTNKNGEVDIKINPNSNRAGEFLLVHEITHAIETDSMKKLVLDYASKNVEFNNALESLKQTYGTNNVNSEVLADISGQLFGNQEFINSLSMEQPSIFRRIYNKIIELANKITGNSHEALFIQDLRNKWENAYRSQNNDMTQKSYFSKQYYENIGTIAQYDGVKYLANDQEKIQKNIKSYFDNNFKGQEINNIKMDQGKKYAYPGNRQENYNNVKGPSVTIMNDILETLSNKRHQSDKLYNKDGTVKNHSGLDTTGGFNHYDTKIGIPDGTGNVTIFNADVITRLDKSGNEYFYDLDKIKDTGQKVVDNKSKPNTDSSVSFNDNTITNSEENVKLLSTKYSIQENQNDTSYRGEHQPDRMGVGYDLTSEGIIDDSIYTNPEWYAIMSEKSYQESYKVLNRVRNNPNANVTIYRASPSNDINYGDWVTLSKTYAQEHLERNLNNKGNIVKKVVKAKDIQWAGDDINEFGYYPDGDIKSSISNKTWQKHLEQNYQPTGIRTNLKDIKIPLQQDIQNNNVDLLKSNNKLDVFEQFAKDFSTEIEKLGTDKELNLPKDPTKESSYDTPKIQKIAKILDSKPQTQIGKENKLKTWLATKILDKGYYIDKIARQYNNRELSAKYDYMLAHNNIANQIIGNGRYDSKGNKIGKSLYEIFSPIEDANLVKEFSEYVYHKHNVDRMTLKEIYHEANKPVFGDSITAEKSSKIAYEYEQQYPQFLNWAKDIYDYNNENLKMLVKNGVISQEDMNYYNQKYPHYVPIVRDNDYSRNGMIKVSNNNIFVGTPIKKAEGGSSNMLPLKDAIASNTMKTVSSSLKNDFGQELLKTLYGGEYVNLFDSDKDIDSTVDMATNEDIVKSKTNNDEANLTIFNGGRKLTLPISDEIYEAMSPRNVKTFKSLNKLNNIRRALLTEYSPAFLVTNPIKDIQDGMINSQHPTLMLKNIPEAISQIKSKGTLYKLYMANGGGYETYFNYDKGTNVSNQVFYKKTGNKLIDTISIPLKVLDKVSSMNQMIEMTPRLAEFIGSIEAGDSIQTAMYNAQEITTNFKRGGDVTKTLDKNGVTFLNAGVQGMLKQVRNFQDAKVNGVRGITNLAVKFATTGLSFALLNDILWDDDEEYEELSDYIKNNYYIIGKGNDGEFIRIPKGRVISVIQKFFQNIVDISKGKEVDIDGFVDLLQNQILPNDPSENNLLSPLLQAFGSENGTAWYGGDLVPSRLQNLPKAEQYDEGTDSISIWLGQMLNISPYKINYVLDQYSGAIGDFILPYLTEEAERPDGNILEKMIAPVSDKFTTNSILKNQNVSDIYDLSDDLQKKSNSIHAAGSDKLKYKYISSIKSEMGALYTEKRKIQSSTGMSDTEKYNQAKEIQKQINELAKKGIQSYNSVSMYSNYGIVGDKEYFLNSSEQWEKIDERESKKIKSLNMSENEKNTYFKYKLSANEVKNDENMAANMKREQIANIVIGSGLPDEKMAYLYSHYYSSEETLKNMMSLKIPIREFIKFDSQEFTSDYNSNGKVVINSKKNKLIRYVNTLNLSIVQKAILIKSEYSSYDDYDSQIISYVNSQNLSKFDKAALLKSIGFDDFNKYIVEEVNSRNINAKEKTEILKELGFRIVNGRVYW